MTFVFGSAAADRLFGLSWLAIFAAFLLVAWVALWLYERHRRLKGDTDLSRRVRYLEARHEQEEQRYQLGCKELMK